MSETKLPHQRSGLFIWSTTFLKAVDRFKKTIYRILIMKNVFRQRCDDLDKQTSFFSILEKHDCIFLVNNEVKLLNMSWLLFILFYLYDCYCFYYFPIQLFKTTWSDQQSFVSLPYLFFFPQNLLGLVTIKKHFICRSFMLFYQKIVLGLR